MISLMLAAVLAFALLPALPAFAAPITTQLDFSSNPANKSGSGWTWAQSTRTLTLNNLDLTYNDPSVFAAIMLPPDSTLVIQGSNKVNSTTSVCAINADGDLTVKGSGTLSITSSSSGICCYRNLTISSTTITASCTVQGLYSYGDAVINGSTITAVSKDYDGIVSQAGNVTIKGGKADVTSSGIAGGISAENGSITISGAVVSVTASHPHSSAGLKVNSPGSSITVSDSTLTVKSETSGILAPSAKSVTFNNSFVSIDAFGDAITAGKGVEVAINSGYGTLKRRSAENGLNWAVRIEGGKLTVGSGVTVKGWSNGAYTTAAAIGSLAVSSMTVTTFVDAADKSKGLADISFSTNPKLTASYLDYSLAHRIYTGKAQGISVTPKSGVGKVSAIYYQGAKGTVYKKSTKKPKDIGSYAVTVDAKAGTYFNSAKGLSLGTFKIVPKKVVNVKAAAGTRQVKVSWTKATKAQSVSGYQVRYRQADATKWKTKKVAASANSVTFTKLNKGIRYEVQVQSYKTVGKTKLYSDWSASKMSGKVK